MRVSLSRYSSPSPDKGEIDPVHLIPVQEILGYVRDGVGDRGDSSRPFRHDLLLPHHVVRLLLDHFAPFAQDTHDPVRFVAVDMNPVPVSALGHDKGIPQRQQKGSDLIPFRIGPFQEYFRTVAVGDSFTFAMALFNRGRQGKGILLFQKGSSCFSVHKALLPQTVHPFQETDETQGARVHNPVAFENLQLLRGMVQGAFRRFESLLH